MKKKVKIYIEKVSNDYMYGITLTYLTNKESNDLSWTTKIQLGDDREIFYSFENFKTKKVTAQIGYFLNDYCEKNSIDHTSKYCKLIVNSNDFINELNASK